MTASLPAEAMQSIQLRGTGTSASGTPQQVVGSPPEGFNGDMAWLTECASAWHATMAKLEGKQPQKSIDETVAEASASVASVSGNAQKPGARSGETQVAQDLEAQSAKVRLEMAKIEEEILVSRTQMARREEAFQAEEEILAHKAQEMQRAEVAKEEEEAQRVEAAQKAEAVR